MNLVGSAVLFTVAKFGSGDGDPPLCLNPLVSPRPASTPLPIAPDSADRPLEPPTINEVIILSNPFDDIVGRNIQRAPALAEAGEAGEGKAAKKKKKAKRKKKAMKTLLSFGGDDDDADVDVPGVTAGVVSRCGCFCFAVCPWGWLQGRERLRAAGSTPARGCCPCGLELCA